MNKNVTAQIPLLGPNLPQPHAQERNEDYEAVPCEVSVLREAPSKKTEGEEVLERIRSCSEPAGPRTAPEDVKTVRALYHPGPEEAPRRTRMALEERDEELSPKVGAISGEERIMGEREGEEDRIPKLEQEIVKMRSDHQEALEEQTRRTREVEERLKQMKELLAMKSAELSGARAFLSTTDRLSEVEVLSIVRDLNETIYQVAVNLTDEWEKSRPPMATDRMDVDHPARHRTPTLLQRAVDRDPVGLTFLLQSCLCSQAAEMTSSWGNKQELAVLGSVYKRLSTSEGQAIGARWRLLTHKYLPRSSPRPEQVVKRLASVLEEAGSFLSAQQSIQLVEATALQEIATIVQLSLRLESVFMVEVTSSDMSLLFGAPGAVFDEMRMTDELSSDGPSLPRRLDRIAATTEMGVGKSTSGRMGKNRPTKVLLKMKVVLEKDMVWHG